MDNGRYTIILKIKVNNYLKACAPFSTSCKVAAKCRFHLSHDKSKERWLTRRWRRIWSTTYPRHHWQISYLVKCEVSTAAPYTQTTHDRELRKPKWKPSTNSKAISTGLTSRPISLHSIWNAVFGCSKMPEQSLVKVVWNNYLTVLHDSVQGPASESKITLLLNALKNK